MNKLFTINPLTNCLNLLSGLGRNNWLRGFVFVMIQKIWNFLAGALLITSLAVPTLMGYIHFNRVIDTFETLFKIFIPSLGINLATIAFINSINEYYFKEEEFESFLNDNQ